MLKQCKVVMLPTKEKSNIYIDSNNTLSLGFDIKRTSPDKSQHFYIISEDTIKENDWFLEDNRVHISNDTNPNWVLRKCVSVKNGWIFYDKEESIGCNPDWSKKVIATTNKFIRIEQTINNIFGKNYLPFLSEPFIKKYIKEYNKNNQITDIRVEYEKLSLEGILYESIYYDDEEGIPTYRVKVNRDNTITIKKLKTNYTKEELIIAMESAIIHGKRIQTYYLSNVGEPPLTPVSFINNYINNIN